jgi:cell division initiation protein
MTLSPVEIRHVELRRRPLGYDRRAVDGLLDRIVASFEEVWRDREELRDHAERIAGELARARELEELLRNTLMSAERAADEMRAQARKEAELLVEQARIAAREIAANADHERERVRAEVRRLRALEAETRAEFRAFLLAALDRLESDRPAAPAPSEQVA